MFKKIVNQLLFALFVITLKNLTLNEMKKKLDNLSLFKHLTCK